MRLIDMRADYFTSRLALVGTTVAMALRRVTATVVVVIASAIVLAFISPPCSGQSRTTERRPASVGTDPIRRAFATRSSNVQVEGAGRVTRVLPDDVNGSRHQRFIVRLPSGQTLLVNHNIDIAPPIDKLKVGDTVRFYGEYVWNEKGGAIHWTHHDPNGRHVSGWIKHNGQTFK